MNTLENSQILLIITGGIAAYKSLDIIRQLREEGAKVRCILTKGGEAFVTPLTVATLSGEAAYMNMFSQEEEQRLGHINLSREADMIVIAPATADMIAKMAHGIADTLASTVLLAAADKPTLIAPAMNSRMWEHPATQENMATLLKRGIKTVGPESGFLACGENGTGRMSDPTEILASIKSHFSAQGPLFGKKALVTSGPTHEPLDPVRFLGNRSSGKQGHAIAAALAAQGAEVTLITGPTSLPDPTNIKTTHVGTAREMLDACQRNGLFDIAVCAAAVSDWRPTEMSDSKIKKTGVLPAVELTENPDILAHLSTPSIHRPALVVGFAAETNDIIKNAKDKFARKKCNWLIVNDVRDGRAFCCDDNEVIFLRNTDTTEVAAEHWPLCSKNKIAQRLTKEIVAFFKQK